MSATQQPAVAVRAGRVARHQPPDGQRGVARRHASRAAARAAATSTAAPTGRPASARPWTCPATTARSSRDRTAGTTKGRRRSSSNAALPGQERLRHLSGQRRRLARERSATSGPSIPVQGGGRHQTPAGRRGDDRIRTRADRHDAAVADRRMARQQELRQLGRPVSALDAHNHDDGNRQTDDVLQMDQPGASNTDYLIRNVEGFQYRIRAATSIGTADPFRNTARSWRC